MEVNAAAPQITAYGARSFNVQDADTRGRFALPPMWLGVLAVLAFLTLLLSFDYVVRQGVQNAELRRQNAAAQSAATWRCQALRDRQNREDCLTTIPGVAATTASKGVTTAYASF